MKTTASAALLGLFIALAAPCLAAQAEDAYCPLGVRNERCIPPISSEKYAVGTTVPDGYVELADYQALGLSPPGDGQFYAEVNGDVLLVASQTRAIENVVIVFDFDDQTRPETGPESCCAIEARDTDEQAVAGAEISGPVQRAGEQQE